MTQMSYKKRCLAISALIVTLLAAFFLGCLFTKKHDAGKTTIGDDKISNLILNDPQCMDKSVFGVITNTSRVR